MRGVTIAVQVVGAGGVTACVQGLSKTSLIGLVEAQDVGNQRRRARALPLLRLFRQCMCENYCARGQCVRGSGWACEAACYARFTAHLRLGRLGERAARLLDTPRGSLQLLDILVSFCLSVRLFDLK